MLVFLQQVATAAFKKLHTNLQNIKTHCRFYLLQSNIRIFNHKKKKTHLQLLKLNVAPLVGLHYSINTNISDTLVLHISVSGCGFNIVLPKLKYCHENALRYVQNCSE